MFFDDSDRDRKLVFKQTDMTVPVGLDGVELRHFAPVRLLVEDGLQGPAGTGERKGYKKKRPTEFGAGCRSI